jgi:putative ABC transport system permease protein
LAGATAIPIALATYSATVTGSVQATVAGQAVLHTGADVVLTLTRPVPVPVPVSLGRDATEVLRFNSVHVGGVQADLIGVDPVGFARVAYWSSGVPGGSLHDPLAPLRSYDATTGVPAVASHPVRAGRQQADWIGAPLLAPLDVSPAAVLPGEHGGYPVVLIPRGAVVGPDAQYARAQIWVRGDPAVIQREAVAAKLPLANVDVAASHYVDSRFEPLTYTFDYLIALCLLIEVVAVVGLLLYLESRTPALRRSYVLLRRMGLRTGSHRVALLWELGLPLLGGVAAGTVLIAGPIAQLYPDFDLVPAVPPDTVLVLPVRVAVLTAGAIAVVTAAAAGYAQARVGRADPADVLRDAT